MSVVVDSSALVACLIDSGPDGAWAEEVVKQGPVHAPQLVLVETTNVLRRLERSRRITTAEANAAQEDLMQLDLLLYAYEAFADRVWGLRHNMTSYDAWYVALAEALAVPLATLDKHLAGTTPARCRFLLPGST